MNKDTSKRELRSIFRQKRLNISPLRRWKAALSLHDALKDHRRVLSYAAFEDELNSWPLNLTLSRQGQLYLPKVVGEDLQVFKVNDFDRQLAKNAWGIYEPIPEKCEKISPDILEVVLVPGLAFDSQRHRLGWGRGFYDRFLSGLPKDTYTCGIGFKEQYSEEVLPTEENDIPLKEILLF